MRLWQGARRRAMHHLLEIVASTKWAEQLILRGSAALKAVLGDAAREPGDIDWVVQPESLRMDEPAAAELLSGIIAAVKHSPRAGTVEFDIDAIARTDIWTYERAPGHRLAFPWAFQDLPPGVVQMDFVFGETLFTPAQSLAVGLCELPPVTLSAASDEESLAWKLLWLYSDSYPQGKDLYDAMLLAERVPLRGEVLYQVIAKTEDCRPDWIPSLFPFRGHDRELDWSSMPRGLTASEEEKTDMGLRLAATIRPAVEECLRLAKAAPIRSSPRTPGASA